MIAPVLKYPGSKWRLAPWICAHLSPAMRYVEPYCGSAAVYLSLPWTPRHAVLNDRDGDLVTLFRVLRDDPAPLLRAVALTPWARGEYQDVLAATPTDAPVERARRTLVRLWQSHGSSGTVRTAAWRHKGAQSKQPPSTVEVWADLPARLAAVVEPLRRAEIENLPALALIGRYATPETLLYCDPPYPLSTRAGRLYRHELSEQDHDDLLAALNAHPGPAVLSGYRCPQYDAALAHWRRVDRPTTAEHGAARVESLWLNPAAAARLDVQQLTLEDV